KFFVVILPSMVMANVATTNGRADFFFISKETPNAEHRTSNIDLSEFGVGRWVLGVRCCSASFLLGKLVLDRCDFTLHDAQFHVSDGAAWLVEEVENAAGEAA